MKFVIQSIFKTLIVPALIFAYLYNAHAQTGTTATILPPAETTFVDQNGNPLNGGKVFFYLPNTTTFKTTWQDAAETIPNTNPVVLDAAGRAVIYGFGTYRQQVFDRNNNLQWDKLTSSPGSGSGGSTATGDGDLVGTIKPWAGMTAPNQYVFAYGQELSRALFPALFTAITSTQPVFCNSGSPVLQGLSDTTNLWIGITLEISCLGAGNSTVISKTATTVTMAANANVTSNTNATFFPWGRGNGTTTFNLPDLRGYVLAGNDNMGGIIAGVLTTANFGSQTPDSSGAIGGAQTTTLGLTNLPANITATGTFNPAGGASNNVPYLGGAGWGQRLFDPGTTFQAPFINTGTLSQTSSFSGTTTSNNTGSGGLAVPFSRIQPTRTTNFIIKITPDSNSSTASGVTSLGLMTGDIACGVGIICTGNVITATNTAKATTINVGGAFSSTCATSNWFNSLGDNTGVFGCTQPNFTDLAGSLAIGQIPNSLVTYAKIQNGTGLSVVGVTGNASAANNDITAGSDNGVLRRLGTVLGFGPINLTSANAVSGGLANANLALMPANTVKANATNGIASANDITPTVARSSALLNIDQCTSTGDANYGILNTDRCVYHTSLSAARTDTLPAANSINVGQSILFSDMRGASSITNTVSALRAGADTVNGGTNFTAIASTFGMASCTSDGVSRWNCQQFGGGGGGGGTGTVTNITTGLCLTGGPITTSGTVALNPNCVQNYLSGLILSNDASVDVVNEIAVAAGVASDSTNVDYIVLSSALSRKKVNVAWAVGSNAGCLDTGVVGNNTYWEWIIKRPDTGVVDLLCSLSSSAPTMPTNYTEKRRIGGFVRIAATNQLFTQNGNNFSLTVYGHDINNNNVGTTATSFTLANIPNGIALQAVGVGCVFATGASSVANFYPLIVTDQTVGYGTFSNIRDASSGSGNCLSLTVLTNTTAQIRARGASAGATIDWDTTGWIDTRGQ